MQEPLRQHYLKHMGIQPWFARVQLPHARPSEVETWDWSEMEEGASVQAQAPAPAQSQSQYQSAPPSAASAIAPAMSAAMPKAPVQERVAANSQSIKQMLGTADAPLKTEDAASSQDSAEPSTQTNAIDLQADAEPAPRFRLQVFSPNADTLAIVELPHSGLGGFSRFHQTLLEDLYRAFNIEAQDFEHCEFFWPLLDNTSIDQSGLVASDALQAFLERRYELSSRKQLWLFGQQASEFCLSAQQRSALAESMYHQQANKLVVSAPSLNEMMKVPGCKADVWRQLSCLVKSPDESA